MTRRALLRALGAVALSRAAAAEEISFKVTNQTGADIPQLFVTSSEEDEQWGEAEDLLRGAALADNSSRVVKLRSRRPLARCDFGSKVGARASWWNIDVRGADEIILRPKGRFQVKN